MPAPSPCPRAPERPHLLLAEEDAPLRRVLAEVLHMRGFAVDEVADGAGLAFALERLRDAGTRPDVLIADFGAPAGDELDALLPWAAERVPTIVMTGYGDGGTGTRAYARGASAVMEKPFTLRELVAQIHDLLPASARARDLVQ